MHSLLISTLFFVGLFTTGFCMTDAELDNMKKIVDAELAKRQMDVVLASPNKLITKTKVTPEFKPKAKQTTTTTPRPTTTPTTTETVETTFDPFEWELMHNGVDDCFDMYGRGKCQMLINELHMDCDKDRMYEMCEKSCRYCGNHINPLIDCQTTRFGCCPDELTPKTGPYGKNCPGVEMCMDKGGTLCMDHEEECNEVGMAGEWMRTNCKKTCDLCKKEKPKTKVTSNCYDDPEQAQFCAAWKEEGLCEQIQALMRTHCPKTCGFC